MRGQLVMLINSRLFLGRLILRQNRQMSANQVATALRPFIFAVHPDRFAQDPNVQAQNEKALQVFNGYLDTIFSNPLGQKSVQVEFAIRNDSNTRSNSFEKVTINLSGSDPTAIVRQALEKCRLKTDQLPRSQTIFNPKKTSQHFPTGQHPNSSTGEEELWRNLNEQYLKKQCRRSSDDLFSHLAKVRGDAQQKADNYARLAELLNDEIEYIARKTGVTKIIWSISWDRNVQMRRCLMNLHNMLSHADSGLYETIIHALNGHKLILGRGSCVSCDGSLQFGADEAVGAWQKVCMESNIRRSEIPNLERLISRVSEMLGGAQLFVNPLGNLMQNIEHMRTFIVRFNSHPRQRREAVGAMFAGAVVELISPYGELSLIHTDGRVQIPSNISLNTLEDFARQNDILRDSQNIRRESEDKTFRLENAADLCRRHLGLSSLSWDSSLGTDKTIESLTRLRRVDKSRVSFFENLKLHLSMNAKVFVMPDGRVSVPTDWI